MRRPSTLEPGILPAFRLFTVIRMSILLVNLSLDLAFNRWSAESALINLVGLLDAGVLLGFLYWGRLVMVLKSWYLPIGIILAAVGPTLETYFGLRMGLDSAQHGLFFAGAWQSFLVLYIPLFIISWQYSMREVVLFCLATLLVDAIPIYILSRQLPFGVQIYPIYGLLMLRAFTSLFIGYMAVKLMKTQRGLRTELSDANNRLARYAGTLEQLTLSRERNRLARELHDVLAHTLSGVAVELEAVKALWAAQPGQAAEMLEHSLQATRAGLTETRRALQALRASPLEDLGLSLAVRGLVESTAGRGGLAVDAQIAADLPDYPPEVEQTVYRVAEEALRNVAEHAGARSLRVALSGSPGTLELLIADDGQGFDPRQVDPLVRFGLEGMRERAEAVGGRLDLDTRPGGGTQIRLAYGGQP